MWKFVGNGEPLTGIGSDDLEDAEFDRRVEVYEAQFSDDQRGAVKRSGLYQHIKDKADKAETKPEA